MAKTRTRTPSQRNDIYRTPFRNMSSYTWPAYGCGIVCGFAESNDGLCYAQAYEPGGSSTLPVGLIVNGPSAVPASGYGAGYMGPEPMPVLYDTGSTPTFGETWGPKYNTTDFKIYKGYMGFYVTPLTGGTSSSPRVMAVPNYERPMPVMGGIWTASLTITNADSATQIIALDSASFGVNGEWPGASLSQCIDLDTGTGRVTVRRAGLWKVTATWQSESSGRFSAPYQSKVNRCVVKLYKNASRTGVTDGIADYYHFALANADTSPTAGNCWRQSHALIGETLCAAGDVLDLRCDISEVTADSGTTTEGYVTFTNFVVRYEFFGAQISWNDY